MYGKKSFLSLAQAGCYFPRKSFTVTNTAFHFVYAGRVNAGVKV